MLIFMIIRVKNIENFEKCFKVPMVEKRIFYEREWNNRSVFTSLVSGIRKKKKRIHLCLQQIVLFFFLV